MIFHFFSRNLAHVLLALGAASIIPRASSAAEPDPNEGASQEITVSGARSDLFNTARVLDETFGSPREAAALVEDMPGVHVRRLGASESYATLSLRGAPPVHAAVWLGPIPLTTAADPVVNLANLPLWPGATYRVYRGFAPPERAALGTLSGALVIEPPRTMDTRTEVLAGVGSQRTVSVRAGDARRMGPIQMASALGLSSSEGNYAFARPSANGASFGTEERTNNASRSVHLAEYIGWEGLGAHWGMTAFGLGTRAGLPGTWVYPTQKTTISAYEGALAFEGSGVVHKAWLWNASSWAHGSSSSTSDPSGELDPTQKGTRTTRLGGFGLAARIVRDAPFRVSAALDGRRETGHATLGSGTTFTPVRTAGGAALELATPLGDQAMATGHVRLQGKHDVLSTTQSAFWPTGQLELSYRLHPAVRVTSHAGWLARPPSFAELIGGRGAVLGNPTLTNERAWSADVGIQLHSDIASLELTGFGQWARDLIAFVPVGRGTTRPENLERARIIGSEALGVIAHGPVRQEISYTFARTINLSDDTRSFGAPLPGRPEHDFVATTRVRAGRFLLGYRFRASAGTTLDPAGAIELPLRATHDVEASARLWKTLTLQAEADNLLDQRYGLVDSPLLGHPIVTPTSDYWGFPQPGRSFFLALRAYFPMD